MHSKLLSTIFLITACAISTLANAHTGTDIGAHHNPGFFEGLLHPLSGMDHLAAMLAAGIWSALTAHRLWTAPVAFVTMLLAGALLGLSGVAVPAVEPMIASSLLVLGLLVALRAHLSAMLAAVLVGGFAVFHGVAHGAELIGGASAWLPLTGMLVSTAALHGVGLMLGLALRTRGPWWPRVAGSAVTLFGSALLLQAV